MRCTVSTQLKRFRRFWRPPARSGSGDPLGFGLPVPALLSVPAGARRNLKNSMQNLQMQKMNSTGNSTVHFLQFSKFRPAPATDGGPAGLERSAPTEHARGHWNRRNRFNTVETVHHFENIYIYTVHITSEASL